MNYLLIIFILKLIRLYSTNGPGTLYVLLVSYQNPSGKTDKGSDCDSWFNQFVQDRCDLVFNICLENVENKTSKIACDIGSISTLNNIFHNTLQVKFDTTIGFIPNPFNFSLESIPESLGIRINVTDDDISGQELISQLEHAVRLMIISPEEDVDSVGRIVLMSTNSEMIVKIYARCQMYYYGPGCRRYCKPSASRNTGFYACDKVTGEKHCLIGWTGDDCRQRDVCALEYPCHGSSACVVNGSVAQCICPESLIGQFCQIPKRPCDSSPCSNGGLCVRNSANSQAICICPRNFSGDRCQNDVNECVQSPCKNDADCSNTFGSYVCDCKNNHWGVNCEKPPVYSVKGIDAAFFYKSSAARFMQNIIIVLLVAVMCLIFVIGLLSFLYCKNRSSVTRSESVGSIYTQCHFEDKMTRVTDVQNEDDVEYSNYYEIESDVVDKKLGNLKVELKDEDLLKYCEKESVI